jgi:ubiquinone/menaquinone biosynthesis C-methylase UbiE
VPTQDNVFAEAITQLYDSILGPFMFEPFALEMAARVAGTGGDVLEVAAGTGIVTRALDRALAPDARITATDLNPPMLQVAAARLSSPRVSWRPADALDLPFADESFDTVVCQFGVMFYPDQTAGHAQAARVLRPGGRYLFSVWGDLASNPVAETVTQAVADAYPQAPPQFIARTPHGHYDANAHRDRLAEAGLRDIAVETVTLEAGRLTADELAIGFCQGTPLRGEIEAQGGQDAGVPDLRAATAAVAGALRARFGDGPVESTIRALMVTARR